MNKQKITNQLVKAKKEKTSKINFFWWFLFALLIFIFITRIIPIIIQLIVELWLIILIVGAGILVLLPKMGDNI